MWAQIVKEQGPQAAAANLSSAKFIDPRIVQFHEVVLQFLATSPVRGTLGLVQQLSSTNDMEKTLSLPFSPFFRQVLLNIAITRSAQIYDRVSGFFSVMPESSFNHSIWCVIADECAEGLAPRYAQTDATYRTWVRQYMIAKYFMAANFPNVCTTYLGGRHTINSMRTLMVYALDEQGGALKVSFASPAQETWEKLLPCLTENNGGLRTFTEADRDQVLISAKKYLRGQ
ncbi:hypothetical protein D3C87_947690 [compost metagenome]